MVKGIRYTDEFKQDVVDQVVVHGDSVSNVGERLGIPNKHLYDWIKKFSKPKAQQTERSDLRAEIASLKHELKRSEQERASLKEAAVLIPAETKNARPTKTLAALIIQCIPFTRRWTFTPAATTRGSCRPAAIVKSRAKAHCED